MEKSPRKKMHTRPVDPEPGVILGHGWNGSDLLFETEREIRAAELSPDQFSLFFSARLRTKIGASCFPLNMEEVHMKSFRLLPFPELLLSFSPRKRGLDFLIELLDF